MSQALPAALGSLLVAIVTAAVLALVGPRTISALPTTGERGRKRAEALGASAFFRRIEPLLRALAETVAQLPLGSWRQKVEKRLALAGCPFGLSANELVTVSVVSAVLFAFAGALASADLGRGPGPGAVLGTVFGAMSPWLKLGEMTKTRQLLICRHLPQAIDLIALAMEAGLDFIGAVAQTAAQLPNGGAMRFELEHLLDKLSLGWSRRAALASLAERIPAAPLKEFTGAVIQADQRGNPLATVLAVQAQIMRTRRSQRAEQAAARAAVLILGPLMLIFACVFLVLLGPFAVKAIRGQLF
jgi:tight adherence protein C